MSNGFLLDIVTPGKVLISQEVESVELPGKEGEFQILSGHTPFITNLRIGPVIVKDGVEKRYFSISGGICEVLPNRTSIVAQTGEIDQEINTQRAEEALERAKQRIENSKMDPSIDLDRATLALERAMNRLKVSGMGKD